MCMSLHEEEVHAFLLHEVSVCLPVAVCVCECVYMCKRESSARDKLFRHVWTLDAHFILHMLHTVYTHLILHTVYIHLGLHTLHMVYTHLGLHTHLYRNLSLNFSLEDYHKPQSDSCDPSVLGEDGSHFTHTCMPVHCNKIKQNVFIYCLRYY